MLPIGRDDQGLVEKDLLGFPKRYAVKLPILLKVSIIPIKAGAALERILWRHAWQYMSAIYASQR